MADYIREINRRISSREVDKQLSLFEKTGIPLTPRETAPMNNHLARTSLFAPIRRGKRKMYDNAVLSSQNGAEIVYHGIQLDMADQDVLLHALRLAAGHKPEEPIIISRVEFLNSIGMEKSGQNYKWLKRSFERLYNASVKIETEKYSTYYRLLGDLSIDNITGEYYFSIPKKTMAFFIDNAFGYVNMQRRLALEQRIDLAKWIQTFATSNSKEPYSIGLARLRELCGYESPLRKFREALHEALKELVRVGEFVYADISETDLVKWLRK